MMLLYTTKMSIDNIFKEAKMARIPENQIAKIKAHISLLALIKRQGYQPQKQGKDWAICCPFHPDDDTPSLIISEQKNLYHCFGCGAAGTVIDWVMKTQGVSFRHAAELLQQEAIPLAAPTPVKRSTPTQT